MLQPIGGSEVDRPLHENKRLLDRYYIAIKSMVSAMFITADDPVV